MTFSMYFFFQSRTQSSYDCFHGSQQKRVKEGELEGGRKRRNGEEGEEQRKNGKHKERRNKMQEGGERRQECDEAGQGYLTRRVTETGTRGQWVYVIIVHYVQYDIVYVCFLFVHFKLSLSSCLRLCLSPFPLSPPYFLSCSLLSISSLFFSF